VELYRYSPNTSSWRGAQLKEAQGQLYLLLYPINMRLGVPQSQSERGGEDKTALPLQGIQPRSSNPQPSHYTD